jgi:hypothetical protein
MVGLTPFIIHDEKNFISSEQPIWHICHMSWYDTCWNLPWFPRFFVHFYLVNTPSRSSISTWYQHVSRKKTMHRLFNELIKKSIRWWPFDWRENASLADPLNRVTRRVRENVAQNVTQPVKVKING